MTLLGAFTVGPGMLRRMELAFIPFARALASQYTSCGEAPGAISPAIFKGVVAGVVRVIRARLLSGKAADLPNTVKPLAAWIVSLLGSPTDEPPGPAGCLASGPWAQESLRAGGLALKQGEGARSRILAAVANVGMRRGYWGLTTAEIRAQASVSRHEFESHFANLDQCFLATIETLACSAAAEAAQAARRSPDWDHRVCQAAFNLCARIARDPAFARFGFIEIFEPGKPGLEVRARILSIAATALQRAIPIERRPDDLAAEASVAASWRIARDIAKRGPRSLANLAPATAYIALAPAIGSDEALRSIQAGLQR